MYFKPLWLIIFAGFFWSVLNVAIWFRLVFPRDDDFLKTTGKHRRKHSELHEELAKLHQAIIRMKGNEAAVDRLLSRYTRSKLGKNLPTIYCITPTYARPTQKADLTRLCQTLQHVWNFHWIVIEDSENNTDLVSRFLERCGVTYTHLTRRTSPHLRRKSEKEKLWQHPRGMEQRNEGLEWIRRNFDPKRMKGVVYFGDDDNTYDVEIFTKMRQTKSVSVWPVGLSGGLHWEGPVRENNTIVDFHVAYKPNHEIPTDMAGFAINAELVVKYPYLKFNPNSAAIGHSETALLAMVTSRDKIEPLGDLCNKVLVWHTKTAKARLNLVAKLEKVRKSSWPDLES